MKLVFLFALGFAAWKFTGVEIPARKVWLWLPFPPAVMDVPFTPEVVEAAKNAMLDAALPVPSDIAKGIRFEIPKEGVNILCLTRQTGRPQEDAIVLNTIASAWIRSNPILGVKIVSNAKPTLRPGEGQRSIPRSLFWCVAACGIGALLLRIPRILPVRRAEKRVRFRSLVLHCVGASHDL
jgi:hypothetical protein